jgi:hypothetical protein
MKDALLTNSKALPAAAANNAHTALDMGAVSSGSGRRVSGQIDLVLTVPATPSLVDDKTITCTVQDSADNSSFANLPMVGVVTGVATSQGGPATTFTWRLPPTCRRYVTVDRAVLTAGGSNIAVSTTIALVFH